MGPVQYKNKKFRLIAAFAASLYLLVYGRPFDLFDAITSPSFYIVVAIGFFAALVLVEFVHFATKKLDYKYGWRSKFIERFTAQLIFCVIIPALIDLLFFYFYFKIQGQNIFNNGFFHIDLPVVTGFLMLLSFYYCLHYWMLTDNRNVEKHLELALKNIQSEEKSRTKDEVIWTEVKGHKMYFKSENVFCFYRLGRKVYFLVNDGSEYSITSTIGELEEQYTECGFVRINRGVIVNIKFITGHKTGSRKNTLQIIVDENIYKLILKLGKDQFQVTKEYISAFRDKF